MNIGIDKMGFFVPAHYIEMSDLATARNIDPNKFKIGLGQDQMAFTTLSQDTVSLAANAAHLILDDADKEAIDLIILATESSTDHSKSGATTIHRLLGINPHVRAFDMKQACYAGTSALQLAKAHIALHPTKKALIVTSDISRYGLNSAGEPTQGAGSVAMIVSANPRLLVLENNETYFTDDIYDFWRPNYSDVALVDGKYSNDQYQRFFQEVYQTYLKETHRTLTDFKALCFHIPYTKIGLKALQTVADEETHPELFDMYRKSTIYNRRVGNIYTGSLFLSLQSLLEFGDLKSGDLIGLFSYGSGAVAEFFSAIVQPNYKDALIVNHEALLDARMQLSIEDYESLYKEQLVTDGSLQDIDGSQDPSVITLKSVHNHQRQYDVKTQ